GTAAALLDMANLQADAGQPRAALHALETGLAQLRRKAGDHHPQAIDMLRAMCVLERTIDAMAEAVRDCRASLRLAEELHGRNHRAVIDASRQLAALDVDLGRCNEAETILQDTTAWMRARLDGDHPDLARANDSLGIVAWERGDDERALRLLRQSLAT